jgi:mRNA-degrading endonuclease RelE of RelBE toxin-antitoxin system
MTWTVAFTSKAKKQTDRLPKRIREILFTLVLEIRTSGPVRGDWPNYAKLSDHRHHCHLKKGNPTYVAVWKESQNAIRLIEVIYAGTHEKAPY